MAMEPPTCRVEHHAPDLVALFDNVTGFGRELTVYKTNAIAILGLYHDAVHVSLLRPFLDYSAAAGRSERL